MSKDLNPKPLPISDYDVLTRVPPKPELKVDKRVETEINKIQTQTQRTYQYDLYEVTRLRLDHKSDPYFGFFLASLARDPTDEKSITNYILYNLFWLHYYPKLPHPPLVLGQHDTRAMHFVFLRIISACDTAHDFTSTVFREAYEDLQKTKKDEIPKVKETWKMDWTLKWNEHKGDFYEAMKEAVALGVVDTCKKSLGIDLGFSILTYCITVIGWLLPEEGTRGFRREIAKFTIGTKANGSKETHEDVCVWCIKQFLLSDEVAKQVVMLITKIIGLEASEVSSVLDSADSDMAEISKAMNPTISQKPVKITIDATSSGFNTSELLKSIIASSSSKSVFERFVERFFGGNKFIGFVEDSLVNDFDPARCGIVAKTAQTVGNYVKFNGNIFFRVSFDKSNPKVILNADITKQGDDVVCNCRNFYGSVINKTYKSTDICISTCAKNIILKYSVYGDWENPTMYEEMYKIALGKHLGDFMISLKHIGDTGPKLALSIDRIMANYTSLGSKTMLMDGGTGADLYNRLYVFEQLTSKIPRLLTYEKSKKQNTGSSGAGSSGAGSSGAGSSGAFGKVTSRIKKMSNSELKNKLKSVGIQITKTIRGKKKYLTRKELENKARLFNNLQNTAKRMKIKIMYKRNGFYKYKTYKRLQKEINSKYNNNRKYKKPLVRNFNFG
jgi:hypothetical protein